MSWFHVCKHLKNASKSCTFADCPIFYGRDNEFDAFRVRCCYFGPEQQNKTKRSYQKSERIAALSNNPIQEQKGATE